MIYEAGVAPHWSAAKIPTRVWETLMGGARLRMGPRTRREKAQGVCPHKSHSSLRPQCPQLSNGGMERVAGISQLPAGPTAREFRTRGWVTLHTENLQRIPSS